MHDSGYSTLIADSRLRLLPRGLRGRLVSTVLSELEAGGEAGLRERVATRAQREYGSIVLAILLPIVIDLVIRVVVEWWRNRAEAGPGVEA